MWPRGEQEARSSFICCCYRILWLDGVAGFGVGALLEDGTSILGTLGFWARDLGWAGVCLPSSPSSSVPSATIPQPPESDTPPEDH